MKYIGPPPPRDVPCRHPRIVFDGVRPEKPSPHIHGGDVIEETGHCATCGAPFVRIRRTRPPEPWRLAG